MIGLFHGATAYTASARGRSLATTNISSYSSGDPARPVEAMEEGKCCQGSDGGRGRRRRDTGEMDESDENSVLV